MSLPVQVSSISSLWIFSMPVRVSANAVLGYSALVLLPSSHPQSLSYYFSTSSDRICFRATDPIYERYESLESVPMRKAYTLDVVVPANSGTNSRPWPVVSNTCRYQHYLCCGGLTLVLHYLPSELLIHAGAKELLFNPAGHTGRAPLTEQLCFKSSQVISRAPLFHESYRRN